MVEKPFTIKPVTEADREWITPFLIEHWGTVRFVSRGRLFRADDNPGFVALRDGSPVGLITWEIYRGDCEITSVNSLVEGAGIGTGFIQSVKDTAIHSGCRRLWLVTTNDNTHALKFYQKRGFTIAAVYPDAIKQSRLLKPEIPYTGNEGIPIRDEIEMEMLL